MADAHPVVSASSKGRVCVSLLISTGGRFFSVSQSYWFEVDQADAVDSVELGGPTRFINHDSERANVEARSGSSRRPVPLTRF